MQQSLSAKKLYRKKAQPPDGCAVRNRSLGWIKLTTSPGTNCSFRVICAKAWEEEKVPFPLNSINGGRDLGA
eukprot:2367506-Rhodomonas_salina.1